MTFHEKSAKFFFKIFKYENQIFFYSRVIMGKKKTYFLLIRIYAQIRALNPAGITQAWVCTNWLHTYSTGLIGFAT